MLERAVHNHYWDFTSRLKNIKICFGKKQFLLQYVLEYSLKALLALFLFI